MLSAQALCDEIAAVGREILVAFTTAYQIREMATRCRPGAIGREMAEFMAANANSLLPQAKELLRRWQLVRPQLLAVADGRSSHDDAFDYVQITAVAFNAECLDLYGEETKTRPVEVTFDSVISRWPALRQMLLKGVGAIGQNEMSNPQFADRCKRIQVETAKAMQAAAAASQLAAFQPPPAGRKEASEGDGITIAQAAMISGFNKGVISRAVDAGDIKSNGRTGSDRRVSAEDFTRWQLKRAERDAKRDAKRETAEAINKKLRRS